MEKFFLKLFDLKKIPTKFIFVVWLSCCIILFVPEKFLSKLNLTEFLVEFGKYLGIVFVICSGFLLVVLFAFIFDTVHRKRFRKRLRKQIIESLNELDRYEQSILREFILVGKYTLPLPFNDESVISLTSKGILFQHSNSNFGSPFDLRLFYSISEFAKENLKPEMIRLPDKEDFTKEEEKWLIDNRPSWNKQDRCY